MTHQFFHMQKKLEKTEEEWEEEENTIHEEDKEKEKLLEDTYAIW